MTKTKILLLGLIMLAQLSVNSQAPPSSDPNWVLNTTLSDEFNTNTYSNTYTATNAPDPNKWHVFDCNVDNFFCSWGGSTGLKGGNVEVSGGSLNLRTDNQTVSPNGYNATGYTQYKTGGVQTGQNYSYGYFEIRAQLPGFTSTVTGLPVGDKFWPSFWTYYHVETWTPTYCLNAHKEIDILEPSGSEYQGTTNVAGFWSDDGACGWMPKIGASTITVSNANALYLGYHKYAAEWGSNRIVFYLDDVPFKTVYNDPGLISSFNHNVVIDSQLDGNVAFNSGTPFPQYMKIDYFRYYTLRKDCSNGASLYSNSDITNFFVTPAIKSYINIGSGTISLSSGDVRVFRFVNDMTVLGDFTVPSGAELCLLPTPCD